jgi:hypothetical protein
MPRDKDLFETIETQARNVIELIEAEMADLRGRLAQLEDQHARWAAVLAGSPPPRGARHRAAVRAATDGPKPGRKPRAPRAARRATPQLDWEDVLRGLPDRFSAAVLESATPTLADNPRARIVAVARWSRAKQIRKVGAGLYEKLGERPKKRATASARVDRAPAPAAEEDRGGDDEGLPSVGAATNGESPTA